MKVKDLIDCLSGEDGDLEVVFLDYENCVDADEHEFLCSGFSSSGVSESESSRNSYGVPTVKLKQSGVSKKIVVISISPLAIGSTWCEG